MRALGRRKPTNWEHVDKYPFSAVAPSTVDNVERTLVLPYWHWIWDQGSQGACVGFGTSMMLTIINEAQARLRGLTPSTRRYQPWWLWDRAKEIDEWDDSNPGDDSGTSVNAATTILRTRGHRLYYYGTLRPESLKQGISANRWARSIDEMRTAIANGMSISIGIDWYSNFDNPVQRANGENWIGGGNLGSIRGGHCVCIYAASDKRQAFKVKNSWGRDYPLVWLPYTRMEDLLWDDGEVALVTDR